MVAAAGQLYADAKDTTEKAAALQAVGAGIGLTTTVLLLAVTAWYAVLTRQMVRQSGPIVATQLRIGWLGAGAAVTAPLASVEDWTSRPSVHAPHLGNQIAKLLERRHEGDFRGRGVGVRVRVLHDHVASWTDADVHISTRIAVRRSTSSSTGCLRPSARGRTLWVRGHVVSEPRWNSARASRFARRGRRCRCNGRRPLRRNAMTATHESGGAAFSRQRLRHSDAPMMRGRSSQRLGTKWCALEPAVRAVLYMPVP